MGEVRREPGELRVWLGLLFAAAVFVGLGMVGDAWLPAAGEPLEPPWFRTTGALFAAVEALGDEGRRQHLLGVTLLDTAIPLAYGWAFYRAARFYLARLDAPAWLRWLPVAAMLCDFAENACIVTLLTSHPGQPVIVATALLAFAWAKWALLIVSALGVIGAAVWLRIRRVGTALGG